MNGSRPGANGPTPTANPQPATSVARQQPREAQDITDTDTNNINTADFLAGFDVGVEAGLSVGWQQGWDAHVHQMQLRLGLTLAVLDEPTLTELAKARAYDHRQCPARCRANGRRLCSRCIHAWDYHERGGRDFLGVEREAGLAAQRQQDIRVMPSQGNRVMVSTSQQDDNKVGVLA